MLGDRTLHTLEFAGYVLDPDRNVIEINAEKED
jgi:hypothetical protein